MVAHVGHDHGLHHWLPQLIVAAWFVICAAWTLTRRHQQQQEEE